MIRFTKDEKLEIWMAMLAWREAIHKLMIEEKNTFEKMDWLNDLEKIDKILEKMSIWYKGRKN